MSLKKTLWLIFGIFVAPAVLLMPVLKFSIPYLIEKKLKEVVLTSASIKEIEINWLLNHLKVEELKIENPPGFEEKYFLTLNSLEVFLNNLFPKEKINISPSSLSIPLSNIENEKSYLAKMEINDLSLFFQRKSDNITNVALIFGLPIHKGKVVPFTVKLYSTNGTLYLLNINQVAYKAKGYGSLALQNFKFAIEGLASLEKNSKDYKATVQFALWDFPLMKVPVIKDIFKEIPMINQYSQKSKILPTFLKKLPLKVPFPEKIKSLQFSQINGSMYITPDIVYLGDTDFFVGQKKFLTIFKGSFINRKTYEFQIKGKVYYPMEIPFTLKGHYK
jgi:hypothetical protein